MKRRNNDLIKEVLADYQKRKEARQGLESKWLLNVNFMTGNQYAEIMPTGEIRDNGRRFDWQNRGIYNHIAPIVESRLAKFASVSALLSVRPATNDFCDIQAAKFSTQLLQSIQQENDMPSLTSDVTFWSEICGTSFYKVIWASNKGRRVSENEELHEGDVEISVCPPYEIYPDNLSARDLDECQSIIHARAYPVERIEDIWGVKVNGETVDVMNPENIACSATTGLTRRSHMLTDVKENHSVVIERYSRPDRDNPEGRLVIVAGNQLLYDGVLPYCNGTDGARDLPFIRQVCIPMPGSFFGSSVVERLIPVQRAYNAVKNRKHEYLNRMAMGILMVEDGSVDVSDIEEEGIAPGKVIIYRQGSNPPVLMNMGGIPSDFHFEEDRLLNEFVTVSGVSDFLTSSTLSGSNMSGVALNLIIEQDNNRLSITSNSIRNAIKSVGQQLLRLYRQYAGTKRLKRVSGENGNVEMLSFKGSDITGDDLIFDVTNESVNSLTARRNIATEILKMGLLNDENGRLSENNRLKILEIMGFGNWESARSTDELHLKRAVEENRKANGNQPQIQPEDNHNIHIEEHTRYLISAENDLNDEAKTQISDHIRQHRVYNRLSREADVINQNT